MENQNCTRTCVDGLQILRCKESLHQHVTTIDALASMYSLVGNDVRFKIIYLLSKEGELCPCDLSDILEMKPPAVSQHLRKLKDGGLIVARKEGQTIFYALAPRHLPALNDVMSKVEASKILQST